MSTASTKTVLLTFRARKDVVDWIDQDVTRQGAACRADYILGLLEALREGRVTVRPNMVTVTQLSWAAPSITSINGGAE